MPRKAPKEVIEHRITLGDYERKEFKQTLDSLQFKNNLRTGLIAGGVGLAAYTLYKIIPGMFDFLTGLFETTPEQKAVVSRLFSIDDSYNPDHPEWALFGVPRTLDELNIMYNQNLQLIEQKKTKAQEFITTYENMPPGFGKNLLTKKYLEAKDQIDSKYAAAMESVELWKAHHNERLT